MMSNVGCGRWRLAVLVIATSSVLKRASSRRARPWLSYSREFQARAAEELMLLPVPSAVAEMLSDYAVMREQGRACSCP